MIYRNLKARFCSPGGAFKFLPRVKSEFMRVSENNRMIN